MFSSKWSGVVRSISSFCPRVRKLRVLSSTSLTLPIRPVINSLRFKSTAAAAPAKAKVAKNPGYLYPERLLIFHAGTGKTVFIGCMKVTALFVFAGFALVVAPGYYLDPGRPSSLAVEYAFLGAIPLLFISFTTRPFTTYIHINLPHYARTSRVLLERYIRSLPADTKLSFTTMSLIGRPRRTHLPVSQLVSVKPSMLRLENFAREGPAAQRAWWLPKPTSRFQVGLGEKTRTGAREGWVWDEIVSRVKPARN